MPLDNICGGFLNTSEKDGRKYISGVTREEIVIPAGSKIFCFPNKDKKHDKSPSHSFCFDPGEGQKKDSGRRDERRDSGRGSYRDDRDRDRPANDNRRSRREEVDVDDIPF